jgi:ribonuclease HI
MLSYTKSNLNNLSKPFKIPLRHKVFTDGSFCKSTKKCGYGVFFEDDNPLNTSVEITAKKTNNIAELSAILKAIELSINLPDYKIGNIIEIYSDSQYSIKSILYWADEWEKNDWQTKNKKPVKNKDLIVQIRNWYKSEHRIQLLHVRAHQPEPDKNSFRYPIWYGNMMADKLAKV